MKTEEIRDVMSRLLKKSRLGEVNWTPSHADPKPPFDWFTVVLPNSSIVIEYHSPTAEPDNICLAFTDKKGATLRSYTVYEGDDDWALAQNLYEEARVEAFGLGEILHEIQDAIMNEGPIGFPPEMATSRAPRP